MEFKAEIKKTTQVKTASGDNVYKIEFATENPMILDLGKLPPDTMVEVKVDIDD